MADQSDAPTQAMPIHRRRSSIADMFRPQISNNTTSSSPSTNTTPALPSPPNHRRGMSMALGLNTTSSGPSPYNAFAKQRRASFATSESTSPGLRNSLENERAVIDEEDAIRPPTNTPASPSFGRRLSFGAQALKDVKSTGSGGSPGSGEGFNWSEALREKSRRAPSFSGANTFSPSASRSRTVSMNAPEPPKELPKPEPIPLRQRKPDHLGERMLRGDFMMD